jgi:asparagine synthase (glutamine-hydrolysing)
MKTGSNLRLRISDAISLVRDMGMRWVASRIYQLAQRRLHVIRRRLPIESWDRHPLADWLRIGIPADPLRYVEWRQTRAGKFFFDELPQRDLLSSVSRRQAVSQADAMLSGRWVYFGTLSVDAGFPPNWFRNPLTGECAPADRHWADIPDFAFGDIKLIWEASRFSPVYALVRAYALKRDERYADAFWTLVEDWAVHNPPQLGSNWKCGQEASFRMMAWCFGLYAFSTSLRTTPERVVALSTMIAVTAARIEAYIGYALSQDNNHSLSEAVGLFTAGTLFPEFKRAESWRSRGKELLERRARTQIYADGAYVQHSMNYQRLMMHDFLWALRLAELNDSPFSRDAYARLLRSVEFLDSITDADSGRVPNYGHNDGALVLPLTDCDYGDFRSTLQPAYYLGARERRFGTGPWDEALLWLFGKKSLNAPVLSRGTQQRLTSTSGYSVLRGSESWGMIRCAAYRDRPAHADQLHLDLWWRGLNVALDSGTFLYNAAPPWDGAFLGTSAHNSVTVDGKDQMRRFSRFLWINWALGSNLEHTAERECESWRGEHDGYKQLGVSHRRTIVRHGDVWNVRDEILGDGQHKARLHWLLPDFPAVVNDSGGTVHLKTPKGSVYIRAKCGTQANFTLVRAGKRVAGDASDRDEPTRGWFSPTYASKQPALSLGLEAYGKLPIMFETVFEFAGKEIHDRETEVCLAKVNE